MKSLKTKRFGFILAALGTLSIAAALVLSSLEETIVYFRSPSDLATGQFMGQRVRLGGLVEAGSVEKHPDNVINFIVTDGVQKIPVTYKGFVPDLFREGQGVVVEGRQERNLKLSADTLLARHDEKYVPPEVAEALKKSGHWREGEPLPSTSIPKTEKPYGNEVAKP
jgi:cytochrome c-type biogenesis protein CcmE